MIDNSQMTTVREYIKYYRKTAPCQHAKFARKSLLFNYAVLP